MRSCNKLSFVKYLFEFEIIAMPVLGIPNMFRNCAATPAISLMHAFPFSGQQINICGEWLIGIWVHPQPAGVAFYHTTASITYSGANHLSSVYSPKALLHHTRS